MSQTWATVQPSDGAPSPSEPRAGGHRTDIDALRALAVGLVVLFHMRAPRFDAGFVGVDVFFVLSGFLITGVLLDELGGAGRVRLGRFWARRIRRLLPASALVVVAVLAVSWVAGSPLRWSYLSRTAAATALYGANIFFATQANDYFAADVRSNPLLHYWSLSVEEQFYVVWPLLFAGLAWAGSRLGPQRSRRLVPATIAAVVVASFGYSAWVSAHATTTAYYSTVSRAWEFGAGALLVSLLRLRPGGFARSWSDPARMAVAAVGLVVILASLLAIEPAAAFPVPYGLLPVVGTVLFLTAEVRPASVGGRLLGLAPVQYVGRLSYSWYLWHWPFLVLGQELRRSTTPGTRLGLVAASLGAAAVTHHLVENPVRYAPRFRPNPASYRLGAGVTAVALVGALGLGLASRAGDDDPRLATLRAATEVWYEKPLAGFHCASDDLTLLQDDCTFGDKTSTRRILVLGDSHGEHWLPALDRIGKERGYAVTLRSRGGCPLPAVDAVGVIDSEDCTRFRDRTRAAVDALHPDLILVAMAAHYADTILEPGGGAASPERRRTLWVGATEDVLRNVTAGYPTAWIHPLPVQTSDPVDCLARHSEAHCVTPFADATRAPDEQRAWTEAAFAAVPAELRPAELNLIPVLCPDRRCPLLEPDGTVIWRDDSHLSVAAAERLEPQLDAFLAPLLPTAGR
ncbi:MAG: acyltransferase family protein [Acidimicrobiales bacterium]